MSQIIGNYRVVRQLGEGGMASAWLATSRDGHPVVLKIPLESSPQMAVRLRDEAQAGRRVRHEHVVNTLDFFVDGGRPVLVIEYVDGCALRDLRTRDGASNPLPAVSVAWLGRVISEALVVIHEAVDDAGRPLGMLHRDVTASNILIGTDGAPKLIDLGIARSAENESEQTKAGILKGTLRYLAPELLLGEGYTPSTDLWSLGVSLFEAALGRRMVAGEPVDIFRALTSGNFRDLRRGERLEPALQDALFALLTEKSQRLRNARAAARMFAAVEHKLSHGQPLQGRALLATLVPFAQESDDDDAPKKPPAPRPPPAPSRIDAGADFDDPLGTVATLARGPQSSTSETVNPAPPKTPARVDASGRVIIGGTDYGDARTLQMPAVNVAPPIPTSPTVDARPPRPATALMGSMADPPSKPPTAAVPAPPRQTTALMGTLRPEPTTPNPVIGAGSIGPTLVLPAVDVKPPMPAMTGSVGPTLVLPAVDVKPPPPAMAGSVGPTVVMGAVDVKPPPPAMAGSVGPTVVMGAVDVKPPPPAMTGSVGPTLVLPAVDVKPPPLAMTGSVGPTVVMGAVDVNPPTAAMTGSVGPTLVMGAVDVKPPTAAMTGSVGPTLVLPAVDVKPPAVNAASVGPTIVMGAVDVKPPPRARDVPGLDLSPVARRRDGDEVRAAPGDVLPVGAATVQMPAWTPPDVNANANADADDEDERWEEVTDKSPLRASEAKPTLVMPAAAIRPRSDED